MWMNLGMVECYVPFMDHCDLVFRIIVSGAYLILFEVRNPKFGVWMHLGWDDRVLHTILGSL